MKEVNKDNTTVFSGIFSLILADPEEVPTLRLPNIFSDDATDVEEFIKRRNLKKVYKRKKVPKKRITACPHANKKHYAKNMCNNCYHRSGRNKKASDCPHQDRQLYAKGMCQFCYLRSYHKSKSCKVVIKLDDLKI
ncbi:unnamed protein product [Blepharisma stoltei]|uniref:Uncharacterized protein n=1 Tax=Blepharisma stoltei TaxID=1481888 RepID=A0AAU9K824_9CILI|nr:unnamed protein product [Blepharisma stoltei]